MWILIGDMLFLYALKTLVRKADIGKFSLNLFGYKNVYIVQGTVSIR